MALSYAFALATITQQINKMQESVNGAFKPLISTVACEMPRLLNTEEAFRRCNSIAQRSQSLEDMAKEGMLHLQNACNASFEPREEAVAIIPHLEALSKATRSAKAHLLEMFAEAEKSPMWQGNNLSMLRPLKKKYVRAISTIENTADLLAIEIRQQQPYIGDFSDSHIPRDESIELINASHVMYGAAPPKWM